MEICTGLTLRFELDSTLPIRAGLAQNETDDSARCAIIDTAAIVACKRRTNEHAPLKARVHRKYAQKHTGWCELVKLNVLRGEGLPESTVGTPWKGLLVRIELIYEKESEEDGEEGEENESK